MVVLMRRMVSHGAPLIFVEGHRIPALVIDPLEEDLLGRVTVRTREIDIVGQW